MAGYQDTSSHLDGDTIFAQDDKAQFALISAGFDKTTGHTHDGSEGEGALVDRIGSGTKTLQVSSTGVVGTQLNTDLSVATNPSDVKVPSDAAVEAEIARVEDKVDANAGVITTNAGGITTNAEDISTNTSDISLLTDWVPQNSGFTVTANVLYTIDGSVGAIDGALEAAYVVGDVITVHNEASSTNLVRLTNTALTIIGKGFTVTSSDNLELEAGDTARLLARTTTILEVL